MTLDEIRIEIDRIDDAMKPLFLKRMECSRKVAEAKAEITGKVYVPEREKEIIAKRAEGTEGEVREAYEAFLMDIMQISRRYQYGILKEMREETLKECLRKAGLTQEEPHGEVTVHFCCRKEENEIGLYLHMALLNKVPVNELHVVERSGKLDCKLTLKGNLNDKNMQQLLLQLAEETQQFAIESVNELT